MPGRLIAFLWSAAEYLHSKNLIQLPLDSVCPVMAFLSKLFVAASLLGVSVAHAQSEKLRIGVTPFCSTGPGLSATGPPASRRL